MLQPLYGLQPWPQRLLIGAFQPHDHFSWLCFRLARPGGGWVQHLVGTPFRPYFLQLGFPQILNLAILLVQVSSFLGTTVGFTSSPNTQ